MCIRDRYLEALMLILNTILLAGLLWRVQYFKTLALYDLSLIHI